MGGGRGQASKRPSSMVPASVALSDGLSPGSVSETNPFLLQVYFGQSLVMQQEAKKDTLLDKVPCACEGS